MKKHLIILILSAYFCSSIQAMETFLGQDQEFRYTFNGEYSAKYKRKNSLSPAENKQLDEFKIDIEDLANHLKRSIANIIVGYAHVISVFPKEGPTFEDTIGIMITPAALNRYSIYTQHKPSYKIKELLSKEEETCLVEFKNKLKEIVLAEQGPSLENIFAKHNNLIACIADGAAIELNIEIFMQKQE